MNGLPMSDGRAFWIRIVEKCLDSYEDLANRGRRTPLTVPRAIVRVENIEAELPGAVRVVGFEPDGERKI